MPRHCHGSRLVAIIGPLGLRLLLVQLSPPGPSRHWVNSHHARPGSRPSSLVRNNGHCLINFSFTADWSLISPRHCSPVFVTTPAHAWRLGPLATRITGRLLRLVGSGTARLPIAHAWLGYHQPGHFPIVTGLRSSSIALRHRCSWVRLGQSLLIWVNGQ